MSGPGQGETMSGQKYNTTQVLQKIRRMPWKKRCSTRHTEQAQQYDTAGLKACSEETDQSTVKLEQPEAIDKGFRPKIPNEHEEGAAGPQGQISSSSKVMPCQTGQCRPWRVQRLVCYLSVNFRCACSSPNLATSHQPRIGVIDPAISMLGSY